MAGGIFVNQPFHPNIKCIGVSCDVTKPEDFETCVNIVEKEFTSKGINIGAVFANAGVIFNNSISHFFIVSLLVDLKTTATPTRPSLKKG